VKYICCVLQYQRKHSVCNNATSEWDNTPCDD